MFFFGGGLFCEWACSIATHLSHVPKDMLQPNLSSTLCFCSIMPTSAASIYILVQIIKVNNDGHAYLSVCLYF